MSAIQDRESEEKKKKAHRAICRVTGSRQPYSNLLPARAGRPIPPLLSPARVSASCVRLYFTLYEYHIRYPPEEPVAPYPAALMRMVDMDAQTPTSRPTSSSTVPSSVSKQGGKHPAKAPPPPPPGPPIVPRIDVEPMYDALKRALGKESWNIYKEALSGFLTG